METDTNTLHDDISILYSARLSAANRLVSLGEVNEEFGIFLQSVAGWETSMLRAKKLILDRDSDSAKRFYSAGYKYYIRAQELSHNFPTSPDHTLAKLLDFMLDKTKSFGEDYDLA